MELDSSAGAPMARERLRRTLLMAAALGLGASAVSAQSWVPVGPSGGDARALALDPRDPKVVYLGTANGNLYRSEDAGRHWRRQEPGFPLRGMSLDDIVVDPAGSLFVGYWSVGGSGGASHGATTAGERSRCCPTSPGSRCGPWLSPPRTPTWWSPGPSPASFGRRTADAPGAASARPTIRRSRTSTRWPSIPRTRRRSTRAPGTCRGRRRTADAPGSRSTRA